jgi:5-methylcytosine-specific restriction endonuclease McrA
MTTRAKSYQNQFMTRTRSIYAGMARRAGRKVDFSLKQLRERLTNTFNCEPFCRYCRVALSIKTWSLDHKTPVSRGGTYDESNTQIICLTCNHAKAERTHEEFMDLLKVLRAWEERHRNFKLANDVRLDLARATSFKISENRKRAMMRTRGLCLTGDFKRLPVGQPTS